MPPRRLIGAVAIGIVAGVVAALYAEAIGWLLDWGDSGAGPTWWRPMLGTGVALVAGGAAYPCLAPRLGPGAPWGPVLAGVLSAGLVLGTTALVASQAGSRDTVLELAPVYLTVGTATAAAASLGRWARRPPVASP